MPVIRLGQVQPGMILKREARDLSGRLLLGAGETVTPQSVRVFKVWGVTEVEVLEAGPGALPAPSSDREEGLPDPILVQARELFLHNDLANPFVQEVFKLVVNRLRQRSLGGEGPHVR